MFNRWIEKAVSMYYKLEEVPQRLLGYLAVSFSALVVWRSIEIFLMSPMTVEAFHKATYDFLELSFFMSLGTVLFFVRKWWQDKQQIDKIMEDDPFAKIDQMTNLLNERDEEIKRNEARLRAIFRSAPIGIGLIDKDRNFMELNEGLCCDILGYENCDPLYNQSARMLYPSDEEYERVGRIKYKQIEETGVGRLETKMITKDGNYRDVLLSSTLLEKGNRASGTIFSVLDITELKETSQDHERLFDSMLSSAIIYEVVRDSSGNPIDYTFKTVNKKFEEVVGIRKEDIEGKTLFEMFPTLDGEWTGKYAEIANSGESVRFEKYATVLDKYLSISVYSPRNDFFVVIFDDITESKKMEKGLKESEEKFRKAIEYNIDAVVLVTQEGIVQYANPAMEKLTGVLEEDLIDKQFGFPLTAGDITSVDIIGNDGTTRCAEMRVSEIDLSDECLYIVSLRDFTEVPPPCDEDTECSIKDYSNGDFGSRG